MRFFTATLALLTLSSLVVAQHGPPSGKNSKNPGPQGHQGKSPAKGPAKGHGKVPAKGHGKVPAKGHGKAPSKGHGKEPARGHGHGPEKGHGKGPAPHSCPHDHFFYPERSACLPRGGPPRIPKAPFGKKCPNEYYWHYDQGCCVPQFQNHPTPVCPHGYSWKNWQCQENPHPVHPPPAHPSTRPGDNHHPGKGGKQPAKSAPGGGKMGKQNGNSRHFKRDVEVPLQDSCGVGRQTCPILVNEIITSDTECVDTLSELKSCGGCVSLGQGEDCTSIEHSEASTCYGGVCVVLSCKDEFVPSDDNASCVEEQ